MIDIYAIYSSCRSGYLRYITDRYFQSEYTSLMSSIDIRISDWSRFHWCFIYKKMMFPQLKVGESYKIWH